MSGSEDLRERLLQRRRVLAGDVRGLESDAGGEEARAGGDASNPAGHATENAEPEVSLGRMERQNREIGEIDEALERLCGLSEDCGQASRWPGRIHSRAFLSSAAD